MHLPVNRTRKFLITFTIVGVLMWVSGHLLRPGAFTYQPAEGRGGSPVGTSSASGSAETGVRSSGVPAGAASSQSRPIPAARPAPQPEPGTAPYRELGWKGNRFTMGEQPFTGVSTEVGKSGMLTKRYEIREGVLHGLMEEWYPSGTQRARTEFQSGKHHGDNVYWNENGTVQVRKVWENDVLLREDKP